MPLAGFDLSSASPNPGDELGVTQHWQALALAGPAYTVLLHLVTPGATAVAGIDQPVLGGLYGTGRLDLDAATALAEHISMHPLLGPLPETRWLTDLAVRT